MEYRRRKNNRRNQKGSSSTAKAVVALLVIAAVIYIVSASAAGTWIAEKVFAPMFEALDGLIRGETPPPAQTADSALTINDPAGEVNSPGVTGDVDFPANACFALQMGVFSSMSNAQAQAGELVSRGAGGYIMEDEGRFRVLAAAYSSRESLDAVREQLTLQGMESALYEISSEGSTLRVTASSEQLDEISAGFEALYRLVNDMSEAALSYDQSNMSPAQGKETALAFLTQLRADSEKFQQVATSDNDILSAALECFIACDNALNDLSSYQTQSTLDFASKMKYTHISIICAYDRLSKVIKSAT